MIFFSDVTKKGCEINGWKVRLNSFKTMRKSLIRSILKNDLENPHPLL